MILPLPFSLNHLTHVSFVPSSIPIIQLTYSVTALMNPKRKSPYSPSYSTVSKKRPTSSKKPSFNRDALGDYINHPTKYPTSRIIFHTVDFTAINDLYPKASVHTLLLPRSHIHTLQHPFEAFEDAEFLAAVKQQAEKLKDIVADELRRRFGKFSLQDKEREAVLNGERELAEGEDLSPGRDWGRDVLVGVHAEPSMNHLHVHVLSKDCFSASLKHRKHYNSFSTDFFIPLDAFPLAGDDDRRQPGRQGYLDSDLKCWRCGESFGNKFAKLKEHLSVEFEAWKKQ
jgi:aprataxin